MSQSCIHPNHPPRPDTEPLSTALVVDLASTALSFDQVAERHNLSTDNLLALLARPECSAQVAEFHLANIERTRLLVDCNLHLVVHALTQVIRTTQADLDATPISRAPSAPVPTRSPEALDEPDSTNARTVEFRAHLIRTRRVETMRRAAATILQFSRFAPSLFDFAGSRRVLTHTPTRAARPMAAPAPIPPSASPLPATSTRAPERPASPTRPIPREPGLGRRGEPPAHEQLVGAGASAGHEHWP